MALIKLDAEELKSQAAEMEALSSEYEQLFADVSSTLTQINSNWSANLANNFADKITNAQKSFSNVVDMLLFGAGAANSSAVSFSSIDAQLAKGMGNSSGSAEGALGSGTGGGGSWGEGGVISTLEENWDSNQILMETLKEIYNDELPKWAQKLIEACMKAAGEDESFDRSQLLINILAEDRENWAKLDVDPGIVKDAMKLIGFSSLEAGAAKQIYDMVINPSGKFGTLMQYHYDLLHEATRLGNQGDMGGAIVTLLQSMGVGLFGVAYGVFEAGSEVLISTGKKPIELALSITETMGMVIPGEYGKSIAYVTEQGNELVTSISDYLSSLL